MERHGAMQAAWHTMRGVFRLARVAVHLATALVLAGGAFPLLANPRRRAILQRWSRQLLALLGLRLQIAGGVPQPGELVVANHVSWLDIFVINAVAPCAFVAKDDVRGWPLVGWLSGRNGTIFIARRSARAAHQASAAVAAALAGGATVAVFPEGTTSPGEGVLPFHGALLQGALGAAAPVRPLALRYREGPAATQRPSVAAAYCGDTTLLESLWRIACARQLSVEATVLPGIGGAGESRRQLVTSARSVIAVAIANGGRQRQMPPAGQAPAMAVAAIECREGTSCSSSSLTA